MRPASVLAKLREEWGKLLAVKNPGLQGKTFSQPVVTAALTHGLSIAGYLVRRIEGDEIIMPDLYWDNYELVFCEAYGAKFTFYNTFVNGGFDVAAFREGAQCRQSGEEDCSSELPQ